MSDDATWADLRTFLDDEFEVKDHDFDLLGVRLPDGTVGVRRRDDTVEVACPVRNVDQPDHSRALAIASEHTHVSLCTMRDVLFVRRVIPLAYATRELLASSLRDVSRLARKLGPEVSGRTRQRTDAVFAHLVD